jgi:hypothetical protein
MERPNTFDSRPDPVLGRLLREHLSGPDPEGFVARVRAALDQPDTAMDVLASWARRGLAAAVLLALAAGLWLSLAVRRLPASASEDELLPGPEMLVASVVEGG